MLEEIIAIVTTRSVSCFTSIRVWVENHIKTVFKTYGYNARLFLEGPWGQDWKIFLEEDDFSSISNIQTTLSFTDVFIV